MNNYSRGSNSTKDYDFFEWLFECRASLLFFVILAYVGIPVAILLLYSIIWFEHFGSDLKRTIINRMVTHVCWFLKTKTFLGSNGWKISLWEPSKGAPPDFRGPTLLLLTVVLLRALRFLPTLPLPGGGMPSWRRNTEKNWKGNRDGYKKGSTGWFGYWEEV